MLSYTARVHCNGKFYAANIDNKDIAADLLTKAPHSRTSRYLVNNILCDECDGEFKLFLVVKKNKYNNHHSLTQHI